MNDSSEVAGIPISARDRPVTASSNQTFSRKVACFTRPSKVVREGTSDWRATLAAAAAALGLIDEYRARVYPVLVGGGYRVAR
jgi:hypothetical protein